MPSEREWREIAADQGQRVIRMRVALQILRAWSGRPTTDAIPAAIHGWIDGGMEGPVSGASAVAAVRAKAVVDPAGFPAARFSPTVPEPRVDRPAGET